MPQQSPLMPDEECFTYRLLFETLNFDADIKKSAEPKFWELGLANGAIENFNRVLTICQDKYLERLYASSEPPTVGFCPWASQEAFRKRDGELTDWIRRNDSEPADITCFIRKQAES
ncbi:hypothetical protein LF1_09080 [Rubripirellula obstinata]|uniref:Uncharacterized protein n=1 Tax=Rubripirellula obstinata TaxID=406547 RepID=A0A5B1CF73_9BACT|nr:hypothetical protein [Rubripirellula obstinata]KAA1258389.1 hypothetical protein LF1_09080 [Rubripirellula obstinata]